ncbi:MAG: YdeI/OmpD-associated family protein [Actinomycetota bacterium]|nr:YdeI/OmpD-associated family protein [Actinomycetota bacterium]
MTAKKQPAPQGAEKVEAPTLAFPTAADFETWVADHRHDQAGIWIRLYKKTSGVRSVTHAEALQVALCYGWIDGQARKRDEASWLQRFCPRRPRSVWSKRNVGYIAELTAAGRMQPEGIAEVERAKADGRWASAYEGPANAVPPADLQVALDAVPPAARTFGGLTSAQRFAIIRQVADAKRAQTRARRITRSVEALAEGRMP